jgi:hypothetical protein
MVDFLTDVAPAESVLARVIAKSRAFSESFGDAYLLHDELETFNAPCYFYEMLQRAVGEGHDLVHEHEEDFGGND